MLPDSEKGPARGQPHATPDFSPGESPTGRRLPRGSGGGCPAHLHLDLLRLGFLTLRDAEGQHTVLVVGLYGLGVDGVGEREAAGERAIAALDAQIVLVLRLFAGPGRAGDLFELALAADGQNVVLDANVELLRFDVRQVGLDHELMLVFEDVHCGYPRRQVLFLRRTAEEIAEQAVQLRIIRAAERLPTI